MHQSSPLSPPLSWARSGGSLPDAAALDERENLYGTVSTALELNQPLTDTLQWIKCGRVRYRHPVIVLARVVVRHVPVCFFTRATLPVADPGHSVPRMSS